MHFMKANLNRRDWLLSTSAVASAAALPMSATAAAPATNEPFGYCLNTSTIRGQAIPVDQEAEIAAKAGYNAFEPWLRELDDFVKKGGNLKDLGKKIADLGLKVESSIGFAEWIVDDDERRKKGLETAKRDMETVLAIGGKRIAAPPVGATDKAGLNIYAIADRYRALAELGASIGIIPEVELWGFSKPLHRLSEVIFVAVESAHPQACILPDIYHLYKGGSEFDAIKLLSGKAIGIFHMNDYPTSIIREKITDADRVYPGDGQGPLPETLRHLRDIGYRGMLSLELFNRDYWKQDAALVAKTGLEKMKAVVKAALAG
jgi:sugar phosphate isomerase/epimerase